MQEVNKTKSMKSYVLCRCVNLQQSLGSDEVNAFSHISVWLPGYLEDWG